MIDSAFGGVSARDEPRPRNQLSSQKRSERAPAGRRATAARERALEPVHERLRRACLAVDAAGAGELEDPALAALHRLDRAALDGAPERVVDGLVVGDHV